MNDTLFSHIQGDFERIEQALPKSRMYSQAVTGFETLLKEVVKIQTGSSNRDDRVYQNKYYWIGLICLSLGNCSYLLHDDEKAKTWYFNSIAAFIRIQSTPNFYIALLRYGCCESGIIPPEHREEFENSLLGLFPPLDDVVILGKALAVGYRDTLSHFSKEIVDPLLPKEFQSLVEPYIEKEHKSKNLTDNNVQNNSQLPQRESKIGKKISQANSQDKKVVSSVQNKDQEFLPGTYIKQYEIVSKPMMGGMGVVYFCIDHANNDRPVALKTFKPEFLPDRAARDRFLRGGTTWMELGKHPHIVRCYAVQFMDPTSYIVLELIAKEQDKDNASLRAWLGQPFPIKQAIVFAVQIARGLNYASARIPGFVHRDLKPENVLVGADKLTGTQINRLRVTDFDLVTVSQNQSEGLRENYESSIVDSQSIQDLTQNQQTHSMVGTPLYMAPEQWNGDPVGTFTDVYAFGCILFEMMIGQPVAMGESIDALQNSHCTGVLRSIPITLPKEIRDFLKCCLALNPSERYQSWGDVTQKLEKFHFELVGESLPEEPITEVGSQTESRELALSYQAIGDSYQIMGKLELALNFFEKALTIAREIGDYQLMNAFLHSVGSVYLSLGNARKAIEWLELGLPMVQRVGDRLLEGNYLNVFGLAYAKLGDTNRSIQYYEKALAIAREYGAQQSEGAILNNMGIGFKNLGDDKRAIDYFEKALSIARNYGDKSSIEGSLISLGIAYKNLGNPHRSIEYYNQALEIAREIGDLTGEGDTLTNLGIAFKNLGNYEEAIEYYTSALQIVKEVGDRYGEAVVLSNLANALVHTGDAQSAINFGEESLAISQELSDSRGKRITSETLEKAYVLKDKQVDNSGSTTSDLYSKQELFTLGESLVNQGDYSEELDYFKKAVQLNPLSSRAWEYLGECLIGLSSYEEAISCLDKALGLMPHYMIALANKGYALHMQGHFQEAIACFDQALDIDRNSLEALSYKGKALISLGKIKDAMAILDEALLLDPEFQDAWLTKAQYFESRGDFGEAITHIETILVRNSQNETAWLEKGFCLVKLGQFDNALLCYEKALELNPQNEQSWINKGVCLNCLHRDLESITSFNKALLLKPNVWVPWGDKARSEEKIGFFEEAIGSYNKILELSDDEAIIDFAKNRIKELDED